MHSRTLTRTRIFRTDPKLDAAIAAAAARENATASDWIRRALAGIVSSSALCAPFPSQTSLREG